MSVEATLTRDYFDRFTPGYDPARLRFALRFIKEHARPGDRVLDIGCGNGATLALLKEHTDLSDLTGMDVSEGYLRQVREQLGCRTILGSILDEPVVTAESSAYDLCVLSAVLHHVIGRSRGESFQAARTCLQNAARLLKPGGHLVIFEPCYGPSFMMDLVFSLKKFFARFTDSRLELFQRNWINLGHPVVSYYTPDQLDEMVHGLAGCTMVVDETVDTRRQGVILRRTARGIILRKGAPV